MASTDRKKTSDRRETPKGSGIFLKEVRNQSGGVEFGTSWQIEYTPPGGKRTRQRFPSEIEAEREAGIIFRGWNEQGREFFRLSSQDRIEIGQIVRDLRQLGVSLEEAKSFWKYLKRIREDGIEISRAMEFALAHLKPRDKERTVAQVVAEIVDDAERRWENKDLSVLSFRDLKSRGGIFAAKFGERPVNEIQAEELIEWLKAMKGSPRTRLNHLRIVTQILSFAEEKGYAAHNPAKKIGDAARRSIYGQKPKAAEPKVLSLVQCKALLRTARKKSPELLPAVVLGLFAGIRTGELLKLDWAAVDLEEQMVTVSAAIAKKRAIRNVDLPANAVAWLMLCKDRKGPITGHFNPDDPEDDASFRNAWRRFRDKAGFATKDGKSAWDTNAMRHTFGSAHYAQHGDAALTASQMGHRTGDAVLFDHYRALMKKGDAEAFFALSPDTIDEGQTIQFQEAR